MGIPLDALKELAKKNPNLFNSSAGTLTHDSPEKSVFASVKDHPSSTPNSGLWTSMKTTGVKILGALHLLNLTSKTKTSPIPLLETKYGLRLDLNGRKFKFSLSLPPPGLGKPPSWHSPYYKVDQSDPLLSDFVTLPSDTPEVPIHWHIWTDFKSSYLFDLKKDIDKELQMDMITFLYPRLSPFHQDWITRWDTSFEKRLIEIGSSATTFETAEEEVAWEVEGFLTAAYLVLQEDVELVVYEPHSKEYHVKRDTLEDTLVEFLGDMEGLLADGFGSAFWNRRYRE